MEWGGVVLEGDGEGDGENSDLSVCLATWWNVLWFRQELPRSS